MNSKELQQKSEVEILDYNSNLKVSLVLALQRTNTQVVNLENMIKDIEQEFYFLNIKDLQKAIRYGSLGKYGRTFRFSTQEVCIWIREYLKEKEKNKVVI